MAKKDLLDRIISDLQALSVAVGDVSDIEERKAAAQADLDELNKARKQALQQRNEAGAMLTQAQQEAQRRFDREMSGKQAMLKSLTEKVAALEARARELTEEVTLKGLQLQSVDNAMNDARRRLAG